MATAKGIIDTYRGGGVVLGRWIALAVLALLCLVLFAPVKAEFLWRREELQLTLRLLWFIPIRILPPGEKKPKKPRGKRPKKPKKQKPKPEPSSPPRPKKGPVEEVLDLLRTINDLLPHVGRSGGYILRRITVSRCRIALVVSGEEADEVGIACGRVYAVGYAAASGIRGFVRMKEFILNVLPDFISGQNAADAEVTVEVRPSTLLTGGMILLWNGAKVLLSGKRKGK